MLHLAGDVIGSATELQTSFVVAGHDRSAPVAASVGLIHVTLHWRIPTHYAGALYR